MTPKEKAEELVNKYHKDYDLLFWDLSWIQAKQCALIAVDEILETISRFIEGIVLELDYWQEVKQEIELL